MADETRPTITYAAPDRSVRRRIRRRAVPILLALFVVSGFWWAPPAWFRLQVLYWQSRCARYQASPDTVVVNKSIGADGVAVTTVANVPAEWVRFYSLLSPPGLISDGTLFLHEMRRPGGERVIVAVDFVKNPGWAKGFVGLQVRAFEPGSTVRLPKQVQDHVQWLLTPDETHRVYAGQLDLNEPGHFTIRAEFGKGSYTIDGWVRQQDVELETKAELNRPLPASRGSSPPLAQPAPPPASRPAGG